jgi:hypothetical protein
MGELAAVTEVDGRAIGPGTPGPVLARLQAWFRELIGREGPPVTA